MSIVTRTLSSAVLGSLLIASQAHADIAYNQVSLRAEVSQEVAHDLMQVTLYTEAQDADPAKLANQITERINAALSQATQVKGVNVSQGSRNSYPVYEDKGQKISAWRERSEIRLESSDFSSLSKLTGEMLGSLSMGGMSFSISEPLRKKHEDALLRQAIEAFNARAKLTTEALGGKSFKLVNLNLDGGGFYPQMPRFAARAEDSAGFAKAMGSAPQVEAGSSRVSMNASGVIEVQTP